MELFRLDVFWSDGKSICTEYFSLDYMEWLPTFFANPTREHVCGRSLSQLILNRQAQRGAGETLNFL